MNSKIAVIGSGYWGKNLIRNFSKLGVLKYVYDNNEDSLLYIQENYPGIKTSTSFQDILSKKDINGLISVDYSFNN